MKHTGHHFEDENERAAGGTDFGPGWCIAWQHGPVGDEQNGALVEDVISAALDRLLHLQDSSAACLEFEAAIEHCERALHVLEDRKKHNAGQSGET